MWIIVTPQSVKLYKKKCKIRSIASCWNVQFYAKLPFKMWNISNPVMFTLLHTISYKMYYQYIHHDHYERVGLTFVFVSLLCLYGLLLSIVSGLCDGLYLKWCLDQALRMDRMGSWEIKESCVLTVVFHDVGLCPSFLSCRSAVLLLYTVILRHKVRGVNEELSGQCSRPKIRFLRGREQPSRARSSFTYEMFVWKQFSLYITS